MIFGFLNIGTPEMMLIVVAALLLFGGKKLPELMRGLGRGIREFKDASETVKRDISEQINNFEKDIDTTNIIVDDSEPKKLNENNSQYTAPAGTYEYNRGREPDYYDSQEPYHNEPYRSPDSSSSPVNESEESAVAGPPDTAEATEQPVNEDKNP